MVGEYKMIDFIIVSVVVIIAFAIIFFTWILPKLQGKKKTHCDNCPVGYDKKLKRDLKDYKKQREDHKK